MISEEQHDRQVHQAWDRGFRAGRASVASVGSVVPEMLEALQQALIHIERDEITHGRNFAAGNVVRAAIAKATGGRMDE